jgi:hypothetical protein
MKIWLAGFLLIFGASELFQWFQHVILPIPFYGIAGLLLAIASNRGRPTGERKKVRDVG